MSELRKFGPKVSTHPSIGKECPLCDIQFAEGDYTTLLEIGPTDTENAVKRDTGRTYNSECYEVHYICAVNLKEENNE